jgi:tetratricopeptide (TPR) repeat protein
MRLLPLIALTFGAGLATAQTITGTATVIDVHGQAEVRTGTQGPWTPIRVKQTLQPGQQLRTGAGARMALLLSDRTQIRLNQNTQVEIQAIQPAPRSAGQTKFRQMSGKAWVQSKTPPKQLQWETPTAIAGIRGTDWEMNVAEDGRSLLSVFSGAVAFANDAGKVEVGASQESSAESGKPLNAAVVKDLKNRIQWVTAYRPEPLRQIHLESADPTVLRQALSETGGTDAASLIRRARLLSDMGQRAEAEAAYSAALKLEPDATAAQVGMALLDLWRGDHSSAATRLSASRREPPGVEWLLVDAAAKILNDASAAALLNLDGLDDRLDSWLLRADLLAYEGRGAAGVALLHEAMLRFPDEPGLLAALARQHLRNDELDAARDYADQAITANLASYEGWLAQAEVARREGNATAVLGAYDLARALKPADDRAWFGLGSAQTERERVPEARAALSQALMLNPKGLGYFGEKATLATQAAEFADADAAYRRALDANPADYVALTGLGLLQLKRGQTEAALDAFLKAGVMEPRYARVHVYNAVAYYQQGDIAQALSELKRAGELDDKDPLPHFIAAQIESDRLRPADAIDAARAALQRMPYLKSLNQIANDQQGSANLGQAFAFFGMEDWAASYAQESYSPYWAGSHLFLADRYTGLFTKNSELFQGLISDPTVFGAGNRFKPLIAAPASHGGASLRYTHSDDFDGWSPQIEFTGYRAEAKPMAYYLGYEMLDWERFDRPYDLGTLTAAFGIKPRYDMGVFVFADASRQDSRPAGDFGGFSFDVDDRLDTRRLDIGLNFQRQPDDQVWFKAGYFNSKEGFDGDFGVDTVDAHATIKAPELALRHSFDSASGHRISWGIDAGRRTTRASLDDNFLLRTDYQVKENSADLYVSDSLRLADNLDVQGDLVWQRQRRHAVEQPFITAFDPPEPASPTDERLDTQQFSPRLGLVYRPTEASRIRVAYQNWLRPTTFSALQPVATAGIPLEDRLVTRGGELKRLRLQGEWETSPQTFVMGYADYKRIDNNLLSIRPPSLSDLESLGKLRPRDFGSLMRDDLYEVADTPDYAGGDIASLGFSINHLLNRQWALNARYAWTDSENADDAALAVPYQPKHALALGATWIEPSGWYLAGRMTWRDQRYADEANSLKLDSGWTGDMDVFKESRDKRWLFRFSANNLFGELPEQYTAEVNYRF